MSGDFRIVEKIEESQVKEEVAPVASTVTQETQQMQSPRLHKKRSATRLRPFKQVVAEARRLPKLKPLFGTLVFEGELIILAGDTGVGKSILAVTIANSVATGKPLHEQLPTTLCNEPILYYDFELSDRQFGNRFNTESFPGNLIRIDMDPDRFEASFDVTSIAEDIERTGAKFVILDNISALCITGTTIDAEVAQEIMRELKKIQKEKGVTIMALAHVPKIPSFIPLTINHVAGSKALTNLADSVFFIARSSKGGSARYLKQVKVRSAEEMESVVACKITRKEILTIEVTGFDTEKNNLPIFDNGDERKETALKLRKEGKTLEQIAGELNVNKSTVSRWFNQ